MTRKRILFVDDQPEALQALRRTLRPMRSEWEVEFAAGGGEALQLLDGVGYDVVVSDMRMPGMNGAQFLRHVRQRHPGIVRIVLSGYIDPESALQSVATAHQYLAKPCDVAKLKETIQRTCRLQNLLGGEGLLQLVAGMDSLPTLPSLYHKIVRQLESPEADVREIGRTIAADVAMTAKVLQLVNSAYFGLPRQVSDVGDAVVMLGIDTIKALVLSCHLFSQFDLQALNGLPVSDLWRHSMASAGLTRRIARTERLSGRQVDQAFLAGLLHDAGKLVLAANFPDSYRDVVEASKRRGVPVWKVERKAWGASHAEVGGYLLGLWGLPEPLVEAVAFHHTPSQGNPDNPLIAVVHAADVLENERQYSELSGPAEIDRNFMEHQGRAECLENWSELALQTCRQS